MRVAGPFACFWAVAWGGCRQELDRDVPAQRAEPERLAVHASVVLYDPDGPYDGSFPEATALRALGPWLGVTLGVDPADVMPRVRSVLPLDRPAPGPAEAQRVEVVVEGNFTLPAGAQLPLVRQHVFLDPDGEPATGGPFADVRIERAAPLPLTRPVDTLWDDGVLDIAVLAAIGETSDARVTVSSIGEVLERWRLRVASRRAETFRWSRTYEGAIRRGARSVRVAVDLESFELRDWHLEGDDVAETDRQIAARAADVRTAIADALSRRDVVVLLGDVQEEPFGPIEMGSLRTDADQLVVLQGRDPEGLARALSRAHRGSHTLWVAGTDEWRRDPIVPLQLLGELLDAPDEGTEPARLENVRWHLAQTPYCLHEIPPGGAP